MKNQHTLSPSSSNPESGRSVIGVLILIAVLCGVVFLVVGPDLVPATRTVIKQAKEQFVEMIGENEFQYERARKEYEDACARSVALKKAVIEMRARVRMGDRAVEAAHAKVQVYRGQLGAIEQRLEDVRTTHAVSATRLRPARARRHVRDVGRRIELAQQRVRFLEELQERRRTAQDKLAASAGRVPVELERLRDGLGFLREKIDFYKEMQRLVEEDALASVPLANFCERASDVLEKAHVEIDVAIATVTATLDQSLGDDSVCGFEPCDEREVLADIKRILGDEPRPATDGAGR